MFVGIVAWFILQHGYAVIDLQILCPLKIEDICLMKFLSLVLQVLLILHMIILFLNLIFLYITLVIAVKFHVLVCITKAKASQRQCYEIVNGLHSYISMQGKFASIKLFS